jgi:uncharacterized membrane protein
MKGSVRAAFGYFPLGGLQFLFILIGYFSKDRYVKFNAIQALVYWALVLIIAFLVFPLIVQFAGQSAIGLLLLMLYIFIFVAAVPIFYGIEALKGKTAYIPVVGKPIAVIAGFSPGESEQTG